MSSIHSIKKFFFILFSLSTLTFFSQENNHTLLQVEYFYGNILKHKKKISHLAISNPQGFVISYNRKTTAQDKNLAHYNFPDWGFSFIYQDFNNTTLGKTFVAQLNYSFYFGNRANKNLFYLKLGQGIAYNTNPFNLETNNKNIAFGSHLLANTTLGFNYKRKNILNAFDATVGFTLSHYSNGTIKSPNLGLNTLSLITGVSYNFDADNPIDYNGPIQEDNIINKEPIKFNFQFSGGINSSGNIGTKQFPFYIGSIYADKRVGRKSILQFGGEIFISKFLKELIAYNAVAFPELPNQDGKADYKRVSLIVGHELDINNFSILTQFGYYVYYPYPYETRYYERVGVKKYFGKKWFATASIKAHLFLAESIDLGIGIRL
ncbi:acyloxyacyl hydrolase [Aureibaculum sp. 2210JD6-5]|uniref:acyloxyacyl hydrolase n=1 Tax=Aureibaculum sp. 2210JD6-5 TaxID=3103957 RepID=UPI002AAC821E|nr:acyloxyacyl hydrolase [Aureibaculum sp. 2210JD6-5]MDY7394592.1 acyloxyacyl hydrolase [Aureibaculum sp. 2210JD6-5]